MVYLTVVVLVPRFVFGWTFDHSMTKNNCFFFFFLNLQIGFLGTQMLINSQKIKPVTGLVKQDTCKCHKMS